MKTELINEIKFKTSRSSGAGGQHVNKVETKVEIYFDVVNSKFLREEQKQQILIKLKNRINKEGVLILSSQKGRSQSGNKNDVIRIFHELIATALKKQAKRIPTKPSRSSTEKRLKKKKIIAERKKDRYLKNFF